MADYGEGIEEDYIDKVFDRFYQSNSSKRNSSIGSGIGLSFTKDLVHLMHGHLFVQSRAGVGTKILVFLPVDMNAYVKDNIMEKDVEPIEFISRDYSKLLISNALLKNERKETHKPKEEEQNRDKSIVLIVDDNIELLDYLDDILKDDYIVEKAVDGESELKKALNQKFDLIISDIMMPVMDGIEFCRKLKSDIRTSHVPVILLTAKKSIESEMAGLDTGADDYITKPFNAEVLLKRVRNIIESRKKIWERIAKEAEIIPEGLKLTTRDQDFLKSAVDIVKKRISDTEFSQEMFVRELGMSKATLYRKINSLTNQSINEFVRTVRLKKAAMVLRSGKQINIAELAYIVGFSEPSYFTKKFKELFGVAPKFFN